MAAHPQPDAVMQAEDLQRVLDRLAGDVEGLEGKLHNGGLIEDEAVGSEVVSRCADLLLGPIHGKPGASGDAYLDRQGGVQRPAGDDDPGPRLLITHGASLVVDPTSGLDGHRSR